MKQFFTEISKSYMAIMEQYERKKKFWAERIKLDLLLIQLRDKQRRAQKVKKKMSSKQTGIEEEIVRNL